MIEKAHTSTLVATHVWYLYYVLTYLWKKPHDISSVLYKYDLQITNHFTAIENFYIYKAPLTMNLST